MQKLIPALLSLLMTAPLSAQVIVAEGEKFLPQDARGWRVTHQQDSYGSHTYGGMWMTHGGCLGAAADSVDAVATQTVTISATGKYRVWSKYQAPPYFNYLHKVEIVQGGKTVFSQVYGKKGTDRLWSFSGVSDELWWPWGVDHDAAEGAKTPAELTAGPAELRLITVASPKPAGDRFIDFVLLTANQADDYQGFKPYSVGTPFANEALAASKLYLRFQNTADKPAQLAVSRAGHFQPQYGGATTKVPEQPAAAGQWSGWVNIGPFCRLVHDEGLTLTLPGAKELPVQFALDEAGKDLVGDLKVQSGETVVVPIDITWRKGAKVRGSREQALEIIAESKKWRTANGGKKPKEILFYGAFSGQEEWVQQLKDALGYNTLLPAAYDHVKCDGLHAHAGSPAAIEQFAAKLKDKERFRVLSFGDEIHLGEINFKDPKNEAKFRDWLKAKGIGKEQLGCEPAAATLTKTGDARLVWYSNLFNEEERFADFRRMTELAKKLIGPHVLTGANYSPHHLALYYGPVYQWVDIFKHQGMSMHWAEDYIFSVPEVPQIISWQFAQMRCGTKYHNQPIHFYVMPHAPGQEAGFLRRNMLFAIGAGARHIDSFWVGPAERFTENYVSWDYRDTFRVLHEAIFDTAEAEKLAAGGKVRPGRVAVVLSKATDFHESRLMIDKEQDAFARHCKNAPGKLNQILCRKEQQMLYLALRQAGHAVDLVTEDDIADGILKDYDVVYFAGEWIDNRIIPKLDAWVQAGGILYACAGCGRLNQFGEAEPAMRKLLGLKDSQLVKNVAVLRTLLELPLLEPIDTFTVTDFKLSALGMKQTLVPDGAKPLGFWADGSAAVVAREHGKGKTIAVGTMPGTMWMKSGLRPIPYARGGRHTVYNPEGFEPVLAKLVGLGVDGKELQPAVTVSVPGVEATLIDHPQGTLLTLVNWTNAPLKEVSVSVQVPFLPKEVRSVRHGTSLKADQDKATGRVGFTLPLDEADYLLLVK